MYFFHNVFALMKRDTGPYFYVAKLESHLEARLWNDVFVLAQRLLGVPVGTVRYCSIVHGRFFCLYMYRHDGLHGLSLIHI